MSMAYFKLFWDTLEMIGPLTDAERGRLFTALLKYGKAGEKPELSGNERFLFPVLCAQMERDEEQYDARCGVNQKNGRLGGRPRKKPNGFSESEKTQDKEKEKEKDKEKEKEKDSSLRVRGGQKKISPREKADDCCAAKTDMDRMERYLRQMHQQARAGGA